MGGNDLKKAYQLYRRRKYPQVLQILEAQIFRYRENYKFFYILGMSCLHTGDYSGAGSFLQRALSIRPGEERALLGMAVVHLKQQKTNEALQDWFEVIDQNPNNKYARRGLGIVKKIGDPDKLYEYTESRQIGKLIPADYRPSPIIIAAALLTITAVILFLFFPAYRSYLPKDFLAAGQRQEISQLDLSISGDYLEKESDLSSDARYILSSAEIEKTFKKIVSDFHAYRDNQAQKNINLLKLSNASGEIKNKLTVLEGFVRDPGFDTLETNYDYKTIEKDPYLYQNCHVIWRGKVSNLEIGTSSIQFDLLVGYDTGKVLEGIVPVELDFAGKIDPAFPIEVLGKIRLQDDILSLQAVSIHQFVIEGE